MSTGENSASVYVSIILPTYNEEEAIRKVVDDIHLAMSNADHRYEIIVVDDASTDATVSIAEKLDVRIIKRLRNGGAGASRKTGILEANGEVIVMLDADGSYTAADIPRLLEHFPEYDQVNGARTSEQGTIKLLRVPMKWFLRKLACYLTRFPIPDLNTGLKAFKREMMLRYLWVIPDGFSCVTTMTLAFLCNGYNVKYIETEYHKRIGVSKFHPVKDTASYFMTIIRMIMYFAPLRIFMPLSLGMAGLGVVKVIGEWIFVVHRLQLSSIIILITSIILMTLGLISDLIVAQGRQRNYRRLDK